MPSRPSPRSMAVTTGTWFTPVTERSIAFQFAPASSVSTPRKFVTSWHRPTVRIAVVLVTDRQSAVMGFVRFSSHASGQTSSMSRAMPTSTGTLRNARLMPPGPIVSPPGWRIP